MISPDLEPRALWGEQAGPLSQGLGRGVAARCVLMIVFAEEFWTPRSTIFILFVKWMII